MSLPGAEFNDFLFAPIGEDRNGMLVSVLSGLARLDVDPWQEAENLTHLPGEAAALRLASLIGTLRDTETAYLDPSTIAARLIALLPQRDGSKNQSSNMPRGNGTTTSSKSWWIYLSLMSLALSAQFMIASKQLPTKAGGVQDTTSSTASSQTPPVNSGQ
jgi:hypothetical protein